MLESLLDQTGSITEPKQVLRDMDPQELEAGNTSIIPLM